MSTLKTTLPISSPNHSILPLSPAFVHFLAYYNTTLIPCEEEHLPLFTVRRSVVSVTDAP
jgi:hypothetical protein